MFGFGSGKAVKKYGAIIDVGSGSVGVAIIRSTPENKYPEVIWTHRERMAINDTESLEESSKRITTALLNTTLAIGNEGMRSLHEVDSRGEITNVQLTVSAPWSYTITKTVTYNNEHPFVITEELIEELVDTAQKQAIEVIDENDIVKKLGLEVITRATVDISANGYATQNVFGQSARTLSISHISAISQKRLLDAVREGKDKVIPKASLERYSFMLVFYCVLRQLATDTTEICLVDVTYEATEIGIVRDGVLKYATHAPFGTYTIARDIATLCKVPHEEALGYIHGNSALLQTLSETKQTELQAILDAYEDKMVDLFKRTGDELSIPRPLFIHTDARTESFYSERIKKAAARATRSEHGVHLVTSKLLEEAEVTDTAILLSAYFFHKLHGCDDFEQV